MQLTSLLTVAFAATASALSARSNIQPFKLLPLNAPLPIANLGYVQFSNSTPSVMGFLPTEGNEFVGLTQKAARSGLIFQYNTANEEIYLDGGTGNLLLADYSVFAGKGLRFDAWSISETSETPGELILGYDGVGEKMWSACELTPNGEWVLRYGTVQPCGDMFSVSVQYV
ncbi:hypothetical protein EDC01DRAFT_670107 [Geopyxis carbonaria]|nr:hypothetical protein EDC01DRAFT_670107 [Geopyxis carbonaria]